MLFKFIIDVYAHLAKKNGRKVVRSKSGRMFPIKDSRLIREENNIISSLKAQYLKQNINKKPIDYPIQVKFTFVMVKYLTKENKRAKNLPDLSNLYELPQDCMQKAGIIQNDSLIFSHDGSRRIPGDKNQLIIEIYKFTESTIEYE